MKRSFYSRMRARRQVPWITGFMAMLLSHVVASTAATEVIIHDHQPWQGYFGGQETVFRFTLGAVHPVEGRLTWRLAVMDRTAARGEQAVVMDGARPMPVEIAIQLPAPKPGVRIDAVLEIGLIDDTSQQPIATLPKPLRLYPENPFFEQTARLAEHNLLLFDPERTTADRLTALGVAFIAVSNLAALQDRTRGVLIIGEGVSFHEYRGLFPETLEAAERGMRVFCMAPAGGDIEIPGMGRTDLPRPRSMHFQGMEAIGQYDRKLDASAWPPDGGIIATGVILSGERDHVAGSVKRGTDGWSWIEFAYPSGGRFVLCGFAIMAKWDAGPTPRFLLREILEELCKK